MTREQQTEMTGENTLFILKADLRTEIRHVEVQTEDVEVVGENEAAEEEKENTKYRAASQCQEKK